MKQKIRDGRNQKNKKKDIKLKKKLFPEPTFTSLLNEHFDTSYVKY